MRVSRSVFGCLAAGAAVALGAPAFATPPRVPSTVNDFYFHGTQPQTAVIGGTFEPLADPQDCGGCHYDFVGELPGRASLPYNRWQHSMMAQASRDPVFHAQVQIAEADATGSSDACYRCHMPVGWLENRGPTRPIGSAPTPFETKDLNGISCIACHRMVSPVERVPSPLAGTAGEFTATTDLEILQALGVDRPPNFANGGPVAANGYVIDPQDRRRGPNDLGFMPYHTWLQSQFHTESQLCASCHDISNPAFTRQNDGTYQLNPVDQKHPTGNKYDMYPLDRTFSEWLASSFAQGPVTLTVPDPNGAPGNVGRYAFDRVTRTDDPDGPEGPLESQWAVFNPGTEYQSCQDCHQPRVFGPGCNLGVAPRDVPVHNFAGGNTWVLKSVFDLYGFDSGMTDPVEVDAAVERNRQMLRKAADLSVSIAAGTLNARVINQTGHKMPTGFSEGRRVWLNVKFFGAGNTLLAENGAYDQSTATLSTGDTKVYESKHGIDAWMNAFLQQRAIDTGTPGLVLPVGPSFHLDLNNKIFFDNRIPPRGFTNAGFEAVQAAPRGYAYADGQYWDDTAYTIPPGTTRVEVRLFHQTSSREYIEFLRDTATQVNDLVPQPLPPPPSPLPIGQIVYDQWVKFGKSAPVEMAFVEIGVPLNCNLADLTEVGGTEEFPGSPDGQLTVDDLILFVNLFSAQTGCPGTAPCNLADVTGIGGGGAPPDGELTVDDLIEFVNAFSEGCPN